MCMESHIGLLLSFYSIGRYGLVKALHAEFRLAPQCLCLSDTRSPSQEGLGRGSHGGKRWVWDGYHRERADQTESERTPHLISGVSEVTPSLSGSSKLAVFERSSDVSRCGLIIEVDDAEDVCSLFSHCRIMKLI